jgi:hypothetical protein
MDIDLKHFFDEWIIADGSKLKPSTDFAVINYLTFHLEAELALVGEGCLA